MTLLFLQGQLTGTASFTPTDDSTYEGNETGIVAISGVSGADAARGWHTICNNNYYRK